MFIHKTLGQLLKSIELAPEDFKGLPYYPSAVPDNIIRAQRFLAGVKSVKGSCSIFITSSQVGLFVSNISGRIEEVLGRGICVSLEGGQDLPEPTIAILILQALFYCGWRTPCQTVPLYNNYGRVLPSFDAYQRLKNACGFLRRHMKEADFNEFMSDCLDISHYHVVAPADLPVDKRTAFFDGKLRVLEPKLKKNYDKILLIYTAPELPSDGLERLVKYVASYLDHPGVTTKAYLHALSKNGDKRAVLHIFTALTDN